MVFICPIPSPPIWVGHMLNMWKICKIIPYGNAMRFMGYIEVHIYGIHGCTPIWDTHVIFMGFMGYAFMGYMLVHIWDSHGIHG